MEFKERFLELLEEKTDGNQAKMAEAADIPKATINGWLTKNQKPRLEQLTQLCRAFGLSMDYLSGLSDERSPVDADRDYNEHYLNYCRLCDEDKTYINSLIKRFLKS